MGFVRRSHGHEWGEVLCRSWGLHPGNATQRLIPAWKTWRQIPVPKWLQPVVTLANQLLVPPVTTVDLLQCGSGQGGPEHHRSTLVQLQLTQLWPQRGHPPPTATTRYS